MKKRSIAITVNRANNCVFIDGTRVYGVNLTMLPFLLAEYDQNYWRMGDLYEIRTNRSVARLIKRLIDASR